MTALIKIRKAGKFSPGDLDLFRRYVNLFHSHNLSIKVSIATKKVKNLKIKVA